MSEVVEVEVAGQTYRLGSDEDSADLQAVAALVNEQVSAILAAKPDLPRDRAAILAALNMGDQLLRAQAASEADAGEVEKAVKAVRRRLAALARQLDDAADPDSDDSGA